MKHNGRVRWVQRSTWWSLTTVLVQYHAVDAAHHGAPRVALRWTYYTSTALSHPALPPVVQERACW
ncbi:MAG: hypothetical protein JNM62_03795 [Flavobacteriales bacterium]|nr:hypothetical protein [Flavobacteriales bacterium]